MSWMQTPHCYNNCGFMEKEARARYPSERSFVVRRVFQTKVCVCGVAGRWDVLRRDSAYQRECDGVSKDRVFPSGETAAMYNVMGVLKIRVCREMP